MLAAVGVAGTVLATAGGNAGGDPRALTVELDDSSIETSRPTVRAGAVDVIQANTGAVDHELLIVRTDRAPDDLPIGLSGVRPSLAGELVYGVEHSHHDGAQAPPGVDHLAPGETRRARVRLRAGSYVLLCGLEGHYAAGQRAALTVE